MRWWFREGEGMKNIDNASSSSTMYFSLLINDIPFFTHQNFPTSFSSILPPAIHPIDIHFPQFPFKFHWHEAFQNTEYTVMYIFQ